MTSVRPKISIITVTLNNSTGLQRVIDSIRAQTYKNIELIVVDGGSSDSTNEIIKKNGDIIKKSISEKDKGIFDAMNKGLSMASGDWILFLNAGDVFCDNFVLERASSWLKDREVNYYGVAEIAYEGQVLYRKPGANKPLRLEKSLPIHQAVFVSKKYAYMGYDESFKICGDTLYLQNLIKISEFVFIPLDVVRFELGGISSWYEDVRHFRRHVKERVKVSRLLGRRANVLYIYVQLLIKLFLMRLFSKKNYFKLMSYVAKIREVV
ncbi:putative glycosyltransferase [Tepidimonas sediminis]|uniref:Putative glycosyltransferase n=1 Tax=Tepidimonas sediminis TaxID=2588941 RepID=A0A554WGS4_9BURK|nr:glycosyltransferase family 2 protein [Tepidimonas sediminis]TSE22749.1 putative glycosyltransferase [Tepidimonas sediminis]